MVSPDKAPPDPPPDSPPAAPLPEPSGDWIEQDFPETLDDMVPTHGYHELPIAALGGSAGSIPALLAFFAATPAEPGMVFVVVLHLSPDYESTLPEVLQRSTRMPVVTAEDGQKLAINSIYVIPPGQQLSSVNGHFSLAPMEHTPGRRAAVDLFFRTLADTHGPHAIAIVLSGADSDGAVGIKRIKERGGLTVAQDPDQAGHSGMPRAAIATNMVDWILPVEQMPAKLVEYWQNERRLKLPRAEVPTAREPDGEDKEHEAALKEILAYLKARTGREFGHYKRATVLRRLARRMQVNGVTDLPGYLNYLRTHPGESSALLQDLLISVTNFFRDRAAFEMLAQDLPRLFEGKDSSASIRVWVPACATGEEAFSLAILLSEIAATLPAPPMLQIFATDLDENALQTARQAIYPPTISADVSEERLRRFFVKEARGYRLRRELREMVLFAVHDALRDSPFSRLDLVSCRNLLIYLDVDAQQRLVEIFDFALLPQGRLFVGSTESVNSPSFVPVLDKRFRIFAHLGVPRPTLPTATGASTLAKALEAQDRVREGLSLAGRTFKQALELSQRSEPLSIPEGKTSWQELHTRLIENHAPPSMLVSREYEILHLTNSATRFLHFRGGEPTRSLLDAVSPMLRPELRAALFRANQTGEPAESLNVPVEIEGEQRLVTLRVQPVFQETYGIFYIELELRQISDLPVLPGGGLQSEDVARDLERELGQMSARFRETVLQYEMATEELKSSNEELQAMNEELHSATEELETSREELQSINEELTTVNHELKANVEELGHTNTNLQNLMAVTSVAAVFLDPELRITRFTPSATGLFNFIPSDLGRPLTDLQYRLDYALLREDISGVAAGGAPVLRELSDRDGRWFLVRVLPYELSEKRQNGVVLTFVEVTAQKLVELALRQSEEHLRYIMESARDYAIFSTDLERQITSWNAGAERLLGYAEKEIIGQSADLIFIEEDRAASIPQKEATGALRDGRAVDERWHRRKDGTVLWGSGMMMPMHDARNQVIGFVKIFRDHTEAREAREALQNSEANLTNALAETERARADAEAANSAKDRFLAVLSHELRTPLTPVLMSAHFISQFPDLSPEVKDAMEMILRNIQTEARLIDDMLDLTQISRGKQEMIFAPMDLHQALRETMKIVRPELDGKQQRLEVKLIAPECRLSGDLDRLKQVFWNLLKNASKFSPVEGAITLATANVPEGIEIRVVDSGIGFAADARDRIFDAFVQESVTVTRHFGGLGLGLAIAKATVEAHHGAIRAESDGAGQGATFIVTLPLLKSGAAG